MRLTLIHEEFRIVGASPDGDSVRFTYWLDDPTRRRPGQWSPRRSGTGDAYSHEGAS